ncbi:hypothetical protein LMH73_013130 [Vibrio splendidus]|nr:hypothetical protein [Vibrio splendidus]MCC4880713.1 hypothetical protein [Vibrio splendidus]
MDNKTSWYSLARYLERFGSATKEEANLFIYHIEKVMVRSYSSPMNPLLKLKVSNGRIAFIETHQDEVFKSLFYVTCDNVTLNLDNIDLFRSLKTDNHLNVKSSASNSLDNVLPVVLTELPSVQEDRISLLRRFFKLDTQDSLQNGSGTISFEKIEGENQLSISLGSSHGVDLDELSKLRMSKWKIKYEA